MTQNDSLLALAGAAIAGATSLVTAIVTRLLTRRADDKKADAAVITARAAADTATATASTAHLDADARVRETINEGFDRILAGWKLSQEGYERRQNESDLKITQLQGEVRDLTQHIISLENILRDNGLPIPHRTRNPMILQPN